jgi:hypothetical protein
MGNGSMAVLRDQENGELLGKELRSLVTINGNRIAILESLVMTK